MPDSAVWALHESFEHHVQSDFDAARNLHRARIVSDRVVWRSDGLDVELASSSRAPVLITATSVRVMREAALVLHLKGNGYARGPFVEVSGIELPTREADFLTRWRKLRRAALMGSLFISCVEEVTPSIQPLLAECVGSGGCIEPRMPVRIIAGTTVPLFQRAKAGEFFEDLFYRLNYFHLHVASSNDA